MPTQKQRDYSAVIKRTLAENNKTFEFFALSLTLMLAMPEEDQDLIAKLCATQAAKKYYDLDFCSDRKVKKEIQGAFKKTLLATLTQDFDYDKAVHFIQLYTSNGVFQNRHIRKIKLEQFSYGKIKNALDTRCGPLHREALTFAELFGTDHLNHIKTNIQFDTLDFYIRKDSVRKENASYHLAPVALLIATIVALFLFIRQINNVRLDIINNEKPKITPLGFLLLAFTEFLMFYFVFVRVLGSLIINYHDNHFAALSDRLVQELINAINTALVPAKQQKDNKATTYHFSLFELPSLLTANSNQQTATNPTPEPRTQPKIKTRPAFVLPRENKTEAPAEENPDVIRANGITYHRIKNASGIGTQDFIGLAADKTGLTPAELTKLNQLVEAPQLASKKGSSGIVRTKSEKKPNHFGLFKVKNKGMDARVHTTADIKTTTVDNKEVFLHTASLVTKHRSRKNK